MTEIRRAVLFEWLSMRRLVHSHALEETLAAMAHMCGS
jgi:hypothetical protein